MKLTIPLPVVTIYTDGSYRDYLKQGGWAAYVENYGMRHVIIGDRVENTTNNRMELTAIVEALKILIRPCVVHLYSDSQYALLTLNRWSRCVASGGEIPTTCANYDLIVQLVQVAQWHTIYTNWVKGHGNNPWNNLCDAHARNYSSLT